MVSTVVRKTDRRPAGRQAPLASDAARALDNAVLMLEGSVFTALDVSRTRQCHASEDIYWDRLLKRVAMPVSLAMSEYRGPRRMHHEYHPDTHTMNVTPLVSISPLALLVKVCRIALAECEEMSHVSHKGVEADKKELERSLRDLLHAYIGLSGPELKASRKRRSGAAS